MGSKDMTAVSGAVSLADHDVSVDLRSAEEPPQAVRQAAKPAIRMGALSVLQSPFGTYAAHLESDDYAAADGML